MPQYAIVLHRHEREELTLDDLALHADVHPALIAQFVEFGLLTPTKRNQVELLFDSEAAPRLRKIVRIRRSLGINLAGISVVLDLLDKLSIVQRENEALRRRG